MQLVFVLFQPQVPENVGAAARALKTMGFAQMRVIGSEVHRQDPARWVAHGAGDILERIETYPTLDSALADCDLVIGTTAKHRAGGRPLLTPPQLGAQLAEQGASLQRVALLFGREDRGLSNTELDRCDQLSSIPLATTYPSLNLGQAVMLYAYDLAAVQAEAHRQKPAQDPEGQLQALRERVSRISETLAFSADSKGYRWAQERLSQLGAEDVRFLHGFCAALEKKLY